MRTNSLGRRALISLSVIIGAALLAAVLFTPASAQSATRFRVTITNASDPEMIITPGAYLVHQEAAEFWTDGGDANVALERIAEIGVPDAAVADLGATALDPIPASGDSITFEFDATPGSLFSFAQMLIATNDTFVGLDSVALWDGAGSPITTSFDLLAWDAGTEENADLFAGYEAGQPDPPRGEANLDNGVATTDSIALNEQFSGTQATVSIAALVVLPATGSGGLAGSGSDGFPTWAIALLATALLVVVAGGTQRVRSHR
ncbi:MAG: spondin domain-containing protein [Chloroflexi bacterium]|nr:spondin domain-containing protein [Chloroflexota bacterium]